MTPPRSPAGRPEAWRYTGERAVAFFSVLCLMWHDGSVCTRPAGHKGKHRHSLKVAWDVVAPGPDLREARQLASDYATLSNDQQRDIERTEARLAEAERLLARISGASLPATTAVVEEPGLFYVVTRYEVDEARAFLATRSDVTAGGGVMDSAVNGGDFIGHEQREDCESCWGGRTLPCDEEHTDCLIHTEFGDEDYDMNYWLLERHEADYRNVQP